MRFHPERAGDRACFSLKSAIILYSVASQPSCQLESYYFVIITGSIARRIRVTDLLCNINRLLFSTEIDPSEFVRHNLTISLARNSRATREKGNKKKRKRIGLHFVLIPTRGSAVPQFADIGLSIYYLYKYIHVVWRIARLSMRARRFVVYKFSLYINTYPVCPRDLSPFSFLFSSTLSFAILTYKAREIEF